MHEFVPLHGDAHGGNTIKECQQGSITPKFFCGNRRISKQERGENG